MTGHQPNPGMDMAQLKMEVWPGLHRVGGPRLGVPNVTVVKPYKVKKSIDAIKEALQFRGVRDHLPSCACSMPTA
jgi:indolepyruvate ferredoxin oxidoreductase alpha subunit